MSLPNYDDDDDYSDDKCYCLASWHWILNKKRPGQQQ